MRSALMLSLIMTMGCAPTTPSSAPPAATTVEMTATEDEAPAAPIENEAPEPTEGLLKLVVLKQYLRLGECGHDEAVGELRCAYSAAGQEQPTKPEHTLHAFVTDPPGVVLAAGDWQAATAVASSNAVLADCRFDELGTFSQVRLGATKGVQGYLHGAPVRVGTATECTFAPYRGLPERMKASHLVVMHDDSKRKPLKLTRSHDEALFRARRARAQLDDASAEFAEVAAQFSDEPGAEKRGGSLGVFRMGMMTPEFEFMVLATPIGARSPVFESSFGFHVLQREPPN